ncbi:hypothetical protein ACIQFP_00630 [Nocardiopsis alba]|uniref:hypothetical protein n=1 Tax=Nocardiopsis alba TaxID=53437 RepID=UPI00380B68A5
MSASEVGGNVNEGALQGEMTIEAAEAVEGAILRFREACQMAETASGTDPAIGKWDIFETDEANYMVNAMGYSEALGENIIDTSGQLVEVDMQNSESVSHDVDIPNVSPH